MKRNLSYLLPSPPVIFSILSVVIISTTLLIQAVRELFEKDIIIEELRPSSLDRYLIGWLRTEEIISSLTIVSGNRLGGKLPDINVGLEIFKCFLEVDRPFQANVTEE